PLLYSFRNLFSKICFQHPRIYLYHFWRAYSYDSPEIQHHEPLTDAHGEAHLVLYKNNGEFEFIPYPMDKVRQLIDLTWIHACGRLIDEEQQRVRSKGPHYLKPSLLPVRQILCCRIREA